MKYKINLYSYGEIISTTEYSQKDYDKMRSDYIRNITSLSQYTQLVVSNKPLYTYEAFKFLNINNEDTKYIWVNKGVYGLK